jgi:hypothetical protein
VALTLTRIRVGKDQNRRTMIDGLAKDIKTYIIFPWL